MRSWRDFFATYFGFRPTLAQLIWTGLTLGAARAVLWMWEMPPPRAEWIYWVVGFPIALIILTAFSYVARSGQRPHLVASIDRIHVMDAAQIARDPEYSHHIGVLLVVGVRNTGTPSIADGWKLSISIAGAKDKIQTKAVNLPPNGMFNVQDAVTGKAIVYVGADALYNKTVFTPIASGALVRGLLLYFVDGVTEAVLTSPGTRYRLDVTDISGRSSSVELTWPAVANRDSGYIAGLMQAIEVQPTLPLGPAVVQTKPQNGSEN